MGTATTAVKRLTPKQGGGRVTNAIAQLLRQQLTVPEIYIRPRAAGLEGIDILAVDHGGSGDIHGVEIAKAPIGAQPSELLKRLKNLPVHYKYFAIPGLPTDLPNLPTIMAFRGGQGFSTDGIGRVGLMTYPRTLTEDDPSILITAEAFLAVKPERFLLRGEKLELVERFLSKRQPDIRVRI